jgi:hypothetical protein
MTTTAVLAGSDVLRVPAAWRKTLRVDTGLFDGADAESESVNGAASRRVYPGGAGLPPG